MLSQNAANSTCLLGVDWNLDVVNYEKWLTSVPGKESLQKSYYCVALFWSRDLFC